MMVAVWWAAYEIAGARVLLGVEEEVVTSGGGGGKRGGASAIRRGGVGRGGAC